MNTLREIETSLARDTRIILDGCHQDRVPLSGWSHVADYWVAPRSGLYTTSLLQDLLMSLVPAVQPTHQDPFRYQHGALSLGRIYFDEVFPQQEAEGQCAHYRSIPVSSLPVQMDSLGLRIQRGEETDHSHRIFVNLIPDERMARDILRGKLPCEFMIDQRDLARYLPN